MKLSTINENVSKLSPWINPDYMHGDNFADTTTTFIYTEITGLLTAPGDLTHHYMLCDLSDSDSPHNGYAEKLLYLSREKYMSTYLETAVNGRSGQISHLCEKWGRKFGPGKNPPTGRLYRSDIDKFFSNLPDELYDNTQDGEFAGYLVSIWKRNKYLTKCMDELYRQKIISDPVYISTPTDDTQLWRNRSMVPMDRDNKASPKRRGTGLFPGQKWWAPLSDSVSK